MKTTFIIFDLNLIHYKSTQYSGPVTCNNIPIEIRIIKNFDTFNTEIRNGNRETVDTDYVKLM